jgi:hypothetical protein
LNSEFLFLNKLINQDGICYHQLMSEGNTIEQSPKGNFLQRFIKRSPNNPVAPRNEVVQTFESQLFRGGTLEFNPDHYLTEAADDLKKQKDWYDNNPYWDAKRTAESISRDMDDAKYEMIWRRRFSGQIPQQWYIWYNVSHDFEDARRLGVQLSETLVDAGVSHPHHLVANEVGQGQRLSIKQLAWLFARPDFPDWNRDQILVSQRKMGIKEEDICEAMRAADKVRSDMRDRYSGSPVLDDDFSNSPKQQLPEGHK